MSLRKLVEGDCGGVNPLMQLGAQFTHDAARQDEGLGGAHFDRGLRPHEQMVNEFLGQVAGPPQSFHMDTLLQEMRDIEKAHNMAPHLQAPRVIDEVTQQWATEHARHQMQPPPPPMVHVQPQQQTVTHVSEFFNDGMEMLRPPQCFTRPAPILSFAPGLRPPAMTDQFFNEAAMHNLAVENHIPKTQQGEAMDDWVNDFEVSKEENKQTASNYNADFWKRLQDEWQQLSEDSDYPFFNDFGETFEPYKVYEFVEENPMSELDNAFAKGKEFLAKGDIPSAVLCFEVAAKKEPNNVEVWELLGVSQAENEMDPQAIAALKHAHSLKADNPRVLMALAICYTNESLQSQALQMLIQWLQTNPKYQHLMPSQAEPHNEAASMASSLIGGQKLQEIQSVFLEAARLNPQEVDPDVQEALGVLYNLSSEFDKAVDCFRAALHVNPQNAKVWNRLGASLANGSRSVEAVEAYQQALQLEPGFIRVRYNVGVCCMNLKAYKQSVEHLLSALNMQANSAAQRELPAGAAAIGSGQQQMSECIWSTLKMVISLMGRSDLQGIVNDRNLGALNAAFSD